ncbi:NAD kinase [Labilibaculum sp. DW002]|uniref:NAD kinase n=1 Tax=Paralabilibaculum antarcticum TaxID=2912572 RepID=A0ABT5VRM3_9BACT|nr:NAD kinase [Labilibaculum sp. DW002]MDE5418076.1 NAD kinase [Labilibaculum sp. DW002]
MKVALFGRSFNESFTESFILMFDVFTKHNIDVVIYEPFYDFLIRDINFKPPVQNYFHSYEDLDKNVDYFFSIGGDGTFLDAVTLVQDSGVPIVGVNSGRLGFMADIARDEIPAAISNILEGNYSIEERTLLKVQTESNGLFKDFNYGLNEFTVHKKDSASMITIHTYIDGEYLNSYWADGLIISTPTGSTAYSLSVGGPILIPNTQNFVISPISPHNLTVRPIVVPNYQEITLKVEGRSDSYLASLDSRSVSFEALNELKISKADFKIKVLKLKSHSFYSTLRNKLMWGVDKRN